jgi:hypothetical protein
MRHEFYVGCCLVALSSRHRFGVSDCAEAGVDPLPRLCIQHQSPWISHADNAAASIDTLRIRLSIHSSSSDLFLQLALLGRFSNESMDVDHPEPEGADLGIRPGVKAVRAHPDVTF